MTKRRTKPLKTGPKALNVREELRVVLETGKVPAPASCLLSLAIKTITKALTSVDEHDNPTPAAVNAALTLMAYRYGRPTQITRQEAQKPVFVVVAGNEDISTLPHDRLRILAADDDPPPEAASGPGAHRLPVGS